jgi:NarL family two-component system response regulator LiaR
VTKISVLVIDDHPFMRLALASLLETDSRLALCGETASGADAVSLYRSLRPEVVLLDVRLPDLSGAQVTRQILRTFPEAKIVLFSSLVAEHEDVRAALDAGACAYVRKTGDHERLLDVLHTAGASALESASSS